MQNGDERAKEILSHWASLKGHDRCWWYPEFIQPLADAYHLSLDGITLTPLHQETFDALCERFMKEQYSATKQNKLERITAREALSSWIDANRGKKSTYHDEILQTLAAILQVQAPTTPCVGCDDLEKGCRRFQLTQYKT